MHQMVVVSVPSEEGKGKAGDHQCCQNKCDGDKCDVVGLYAQGHCITRVASGQQRGTDRDNKKSFDGKRMKIQIMDKSIFFFKWPLP